MTFDQILNLLVSGFVFLASVTFVYTYHRMASWRATAMGWHIMLFSAVIGLLGLYTVVVTLVGLDGTTAMILRIGRSLLLMSIGLLLIQRTVMVVQVQREDRKESNAAKYPPSS